MVIENLAIVIGEHRSENFAKNEEFSEIALQGRKGSLFLAALAALRLCVGFLLPSPIKRSGFALVRVFRVVRGESASFFEPFEPFCGKSMEVTQHEQFTWKTELFFGETGSNPVKPSQTQSNHFFYFDQTMNKRPLRPPVSSGQPFHNDCRPRAALTLALNCRGHGNSAAFCRKPGTVRRCSGGWQSAADFLCRRSATVAAQVS
jgi:hypothetical protein